MNKLAVVAIGGNSLIQDPKHPEMSHQWDSVRETCTHVAEMIEQGWNVVLTHGNGPQVGYILRRAELAATEVHTIGLDIIVADTQGSIGYMLQQALENEMRRRGIHKPVASLITQTLVDDDDPAFENPTKPIGGYLSIVEAEMYRSQGWTVVEDSGRGLRRVVASPKPHGIIELDAVQSLLAQDFLVVCTGGGGIPVVENHKGELRGVYAVIDKDRATALLAASLKADLFLISTGVEQVAINFNKPNQTFLDHMTLAQAHQYMGEGHFAAGSMKPKIEAVIGYLESGGTEALITSPAQIGEALNGKAGTRITP